MDSPARSRRTTSHTGRRRIALVHHNALLREGVALLLDTGGFEVVWQGGDATGLPAHLEDQRPDVVLLEWEAPGVGAPLVERLKTSPVEARIVVMSRPDTVVDLSPALTAGAAGCLSVNLDSADFLAALHMLAQGDMLVSHEMVPAVTSATGEGSPGVDRLTARELEILRAVGQGATNQEIAQQLFISPHTVKIHVRRILAKLECRNRQQAAAFAAAAGLVPDPHTPPS